jgi:hypothetical protein
MASWPEDHPGRRCEKCGILLYQFWVDETPPPGTCPRGAMRPTGCPTFKSHMVSRAQAWEIFGQEPHPETLAVMEKAGVDRAWAERELERWNAFNKAKDALTFSETPMVTIGGETIHDWCAGEFSVERLAALLDHIKGEFDPWRGREPGDLTMLELSEEQDRAEELSADGWPDWEPDGEDGEGEE